MDETTRTQRIVDIIRMEIARTAKRDPAEPDLPFLREMFEVAVSDARIQRLVTAAPPATPEVRRRLALILRPDPPPVEG